MSELKAVHAFDVYEAYTKTGDDDEAQVYLKSEADKMIAELKQQIEFLQKEKKIIRDLYIGERDDCRIWSSRAIHNKYKRCLAMAEWCENEEKRLDAIAPIFETDKECWEYNSDYWVKWHDRWLDIANKFKEAK